MTLLPEIEHELLRVARLPLPEGDAVGHPRHERTRREHRRREHRIAAPRHPTAGGVFAMVGALAAASLAALALVLVHHSGPAPSGPGSPSSFPGAPHNQPGSWRLGGMVCPLAPPNRYLPTRAGCVSVARGDIDGDGRPDLILLYGRLGHHHLTGGFLPTRFTLQVVRASGGTLSAHVPHPIEPPTLLMMGADNEVPGLELFVHETHVSSGELTGLYTFNGHRLVRAGGFWYGGDSSVQYGFACHRGARDTIVQHMFLFEGPTISGRWQRTDTNYAWTGGRLRRIGHHRSTEHGIPPRSLTGLGLGCGTLLEHVAVPRL